MEIFSIEEVIATIPGCANRWCSSPCHAYRSQTRDREGIAFWAANRHVNEFGERSHPP